MQALQKYITGQKLVIKKNDKAITDAVLQNISNLIEIDINGLSEITNIDFIKNCPNLEYLSISQCEKINNFNTVKDVFLEKLEKLIIKQLINFDDNQDFIIMQKNLVYLKLEGVLIRGLKDLGELPKLKELNLDHNMEIDCDDLLEKQQNYEKLTMENCIYINLQMDVSTLDKCLELDFRKNKIKAIQSSKDMAVTKMILTLNLCIDILTPERFKNLTTLVANNCTLTSLNMVRRLTSLINLDVSTNSILKLTDLENLKDLKQLNVLNICDNPVNKLYKFTQQLGKNIPESIQCIYYINEKDNMVNKVLSYKIDIPTLIRQLQAKYAVYAQYRDDMEKMYASSRQLLNNINCAIITARPFLAEFKKRQEIINQQASVLPSYRTFSGRFRSNYFTKRYEAAKKINAKSINAFFMANQGLDNLTQRQKVELQKICDAAGPCIFYVLATRKYQNIEDAFSRDFTEQCGTIMCKNAEGVESLKDCPERAVIAMQIIQKLYNEKKIVIVEKTDAELAAERKAELEREMLINPELAVQLAANYKKLHIDGLPSGSQASGRPPAGPSARGTPRQVVKIPTLKRPGSATSQISNTTSLYSDFSIGKAAYIGK